MSTVTVRPSQPRLLHRSPAAAWQEVAESALGIVRETRRDRRVQNLTANGRSLVDALAALGISVEPAAATTIAAALRGELTDREAQVLLGMSHGRTNADIGRVLFVSEDTVKTHARRLFKKLGVRDRAHAVAEGFRLGLLR